jgi:zinc protease
MEDALHFYRSYYHPNNAILSIAGDFEIDEIEHLVNAWYGDLPAGPQISRNLIEEPKQLEYRKKEISRDVPATAFYFTFKMGGRTSEHYAIIDLISDILGRGKSSLLYQRYFDEKQWVSEISAFILGSMDPGLLVVSGKLHDPSLIHPFEADFWAFMEDICSNGIEQKDLEKVRNKFLTSKMFEELSLQSRAMNLAYFELLGDADLINSEVLNYENITAEQVNAELKKVLQKSQCSCLIIQPESHDQK